MTQLQAALAGKITEEMKHVAEKEKVTPEFVMSQVAKGYIVIPKNINHDFKAVGIGKGLSTKINANIGTSEKHCDFEEEIYKLNTAVKYGAHSVMDLSTGGDLDAIRKNMIKHSPVMIGTVPIYSVLSKLQKEDKKIEHMTADMLFEEIENHSKMGVDFITVHCGITKHSLAFYEKDERLMGVVSRGGSVIKHWMKVHGEENPLYAQFDRLLDICLKYDVTLSLGDGLRPGAQADASDGGQIAELMVLGELVKRSRKAGVQVMVEGPGHVPLNQVIMNVELQKRICDNAPFYVLGPLVTDFAPGYDHIVGAIGGALAAAKGADFLCYVTPAEHLKLPDLDDVKEGIIASKIAAHAADIAKNLKGAIEWDHKMSKARHDLDWETQIESAIDPEKAQKYRDATKVINGETCTMCGDFCPIKRTGDIV